MRRLLAGALAVSLVGVGAAVGVATGQGTGGTVGAGAVGTKAFEVRVKQDQVNVNCGNLPQNRCFRRGPRLGNVIAGNGAIFDGTTRVGTALFANIASRVRGRNNVQEVFLATINFNNNVDSLSVLGPSISQGDTALLCDRRRHRHLRRSQRHRQRRPVNRHAHRNAHPAQLHVHSLAAADLEDRSSRVAAADASLAA